MRSGRRPSIPALWVPVGYLTLGGVSLLGALGALAWRPDLLLGGVLAPPLVSVVHLLTIGFVTATILGSLYPVSRFALRAGMEGGPADAVALTVYALGTVGMVRGFATGRLGETALASALVLLGLAWVARRSLGVLAGSSLPVAIKLPFVLAWTGLALTVLLGLASALDRSGRLLGGTVADRVAAHAHLGLVGWGLVLVMAVGNRLLPMLLPSAMPAGARAWLPSVLALTGAVAYGAGRLGASREAALAGTLAMAAGVASFLASVGWMLRHGRRPGRAVPRPDPPRFGALSSLTCLLGAAGMGAAVTLGAQHPRLVSAYGALVLFGLFGQLIIAIEQRLLPWLLWMRACASAGSQQGRPPPYRLPLPRLQALVLGVWSLGPWVLALATLAGSMSWIRVSSVAMAAGALGHAIVLTSYGKAACESSPES